jgi:hypothetical protein
VVVATAKGAKGAEERSEEDGRGGGQGWGTGLWNGVECTVGQRTPVESVDAPVVVFVIRGHVVTCDYCY